MLDTKTTNHAELRHVGIRWLRSVPGDTGWGHVLSRVYPLAKDQERTELASLTSGWIRDPLNQDLPAFSKVIELCCQIDDESILERRELFEVGINWLRQTRNFYRRRWSNVFEGLLARASHEEAELLDDIGRTWLNDARTRSDVGWPFVLDALASRPGMSSESGLAEPARKWLSDPMNLARITWGNAAETLLSKLGSTSDDVVTSVSRWLALPIARKNGSWRRAFRAIMEVAPSDSLKQTLDELLAAPSITRTITWGYRYQDGAGVVDLSRRWIEDLLISWLKDRRMGSTSLWPYVVALGIRESTTATRELARGAVGDWLLDQEHRQGRTVAEDALVSKVPLHEIEPGLVVRGVVSGVEPYGAFVNIGGVRGLLHKSEIISSRPVQDARRALMMGQLIDVQVLEVDRDKGRISLSQRPFDRSGERANRRPRTRPRFSLATCSVGDVVMGVVTKVVAYGAFVDLGGVSGLLHRSEMTAGQREGIVEGQDLRVRVHSLDRSTRKVSLSLLNVPAVG